MIYIGSTDVLRITTSSTSTVAVTAVWSDDEWATSNRTATEITTATTTTIVAAPASGTRQVRAVSIYNARTGAEQSVEVQRYDGSAAVLTGATLQAGERLGYESASGWQVFDVAGRVKAIGMRGAQGDPGITPQSPLTPPTGGAINSGDATTDTEISNMRVRIAELEAKLTAAGILEE